MLTLTLNQATLVILTSIAFGFFIARLFFTHCITTPTRNPFKPKGHSHD